MGEKIPAMRIRLQKTEVFRSRNVVEFIHTAAVEFDGERVAPIIEISAAYIGRIQCNHAAV